jgi:peptide/nickel transport system permease protein
LVIIMVFFGAALLAPVLPLADPYATHPTSKLQGPSLTGPLFGTDELGRDILSRIVWGGRLAFVVGFGSMLLSLVFGVLLGLVAGTGAAWADQVIMRFVDVLMSFPYILLSIAIVAVLGPGLFNTVIAVAMLGVPTYARIVRSAVLALREEEFVLAARALGTKPLRLVVRHLLPNLASVIVITATLDLGFKITAAAGLSFLGLGVQPPTADWGAMLASGRSYFLLTPHVVMFPGLAIFLTVLAFNVAGDSLQSVLDPKYRKSQN